MTKNVTSLQIDNAAVLKTDAFDFITNQKEGSPKFHLVFIDPPFHLNLLEDICDKLDKSDLLAENAIIYVESELCEPSLPLRWQQIKEKKAGQVFYRLYKLDK